MSSYHDGGTGTQIAHGCFLREDPNLPGFWRFYSTDPRFPASIAYPAGHGPFYDFNRADDLAAEFYESFNLICQDIEMDTRTIDLVRYVREDFEQRERVMASANRFARQQVFASAGKVKVYDRGDRMAIVGHNPPFRAPRLVWGDGEMVFFPGPPRRSSLWSIRRTFDEIDDATFATVLRSFTWLSEDWFDRLPPRLRL